MFVFDTFGAILATIETNDGMGDNLSNLHYAPLWHHENYNAPVWCNYRSKSDPNKGNTQRQAVNYKRHQADTFQQCQKCSNTQPPREG
jgi:hypothetical protein